MSAEQPAAELKPSQVIAKTEVSQRVRRDSVSLLETDDYLCLEPSDPLSKAIEAMKKDEGGCAIICEGKRVVGIVTERDLLNKIVGESVDMNTPVSMWMSPVVAKLTPDATIGEAVALMNEKSYRNIPLVKDEGLVGSISVFDVISYLAQCYPKETMNLPPNPHQVMDSTGGG